MPLYQSPLFQGSDGRQSRLRGFTGQPDGTLLVMGARRLPPVDGKLPSSDTTFTIYTSVGFRQEQAIDYISAAETVAPDIFIGPADVVHGLKSVKRIEKMIYRTGSWMELAVACRQQASTANAETEPKYSIFGPILPLPVEQQWMYLSDLADMAQHLSVWRSTIPQRSLTFQPPYPISQNSLLNPYIPNRTSSQISLGADIFTIPFISAASDAGIALTFTFPPSPPQPETSPSTTADYAPLGIDMWPPLSKDAAAAESLHSASLLP